jgi:hypothetical protein
MPRISDPGCSNFASFRAISRSSKTPRNSLKAAPKDPAHAASHRHPSPHTFYWTIPAEPCFNAGTHRTSLEWTRKTPKDEKAPQDALARVHAATHADDLAQAPGRPSPKSHRPLVALRSHLPRPAGAAARRLPEWELYRRYCASPTPTDEALQALLSHPSPAVAGYAFEILIARDSALLSAALDTLRPRTSEVSSIVGSFVGYQELGSYAKNRYEAAKGAPVSAP